MICFNCGHKIHDTTYSECQLCGAKFGTDCPSCKHPNPPMARYCFSCGTPVQAQSLGSAVQNFSSLNETRKNVTVIFADISGFTSLSEKMDPELVRDIVNDCFSYITRPVYELGGTIDKYIGDCVMILFGAQNTHTDDIHRAVVCSMKMMHLIKEFSAERADQLGFDLDLSIGVHYGLVVTGSVGNYFDKDYTVMGDTVNTAQRIQSHAPKGVIYVSEAVYQQTKEDFEYSDPVEFYVKNKEKPQRCYTPLRILNNTYGNQDDIFMIGRDEELHYLQRVLEKSLIEGGQVVALVGEAGIGKSRLIREFQYSLGDRIKVTQVECTPSFASRPFYLLANLLMAMMNISPEDTLDVKRSRIISYVDYILGSVEEERKKRNYQFLGLVMGIQSDNDLLKILEMMDAASIRLEVIRQLQYFLDAYTEKYKSVIVLEDLHWADSRSMSIIRELISCFHYPNTMLICTSRTKIEALSSSVENGIHCLPIKPFPRKQIERMAQEVIGCQKIDADFLAALERFCGGNPHYLREFLIYIKRNNLYRLQDGMAVIRKGAISTIPDSLQNLILSKLNDMDDNLAHIIRIASIIGKDFPISVINYLMHRDVEAMGELVSSIITLKSVYAVTGRLEKIYTFNQETEREVIYNSLLMKQKKEYHQKIAEAIEYLYSRVLENYYEVLAEHFSKAGIVEKAVDYCYRSAMKHKMLHNYHEALEYFQKALEYIDNNGKSPGENRLLMIYKGISEICIVMARYEDALHHAEKGLKLAHAREDKYAFQLIIARICKEKGKYDEAMEILSKLQSRLRQNSDLYGDFLLLRCTILQETGYQEEALRVAKKAERVLARNRDYENLAKTLNTAGVIYHSIGDIQNALKYFDKSYKYSERVNDLQTMQKAAGNLGVINQSLGKTATAMKHFDAAKELAQRMYHPQGYIISSINLGALYLDKGLLQKAKRLFEKLLKDAREIATAPHESAILTKLGDIHYQTEQYDAARECFEDALEISQRIENREGEAVNFLGLAKVSLALREWAEAREQLDASIEGFRSLSDIAGMSDGYFYSSLWFLEKGEWQRALDDAELSEKYATECFNERKKARALCMKGRIYQRQENWTASLDYLTDAIAIFESVDSEYDMAKNCYFRAISHWNLKMTQEAEDDYENARENISSIDPCRWTRMIQQGIS
ncbi:MAG: tetratricopeptide repeat protein [Clostridia bacterium]|jgi:adenylate cyclase